MAAAARETAIRTNRGNNVRGAVKAQAVHADETAQIASTSQVSILDS
jgi:hypothetical protein